MEEELEVITLNSFKKLNSPKNIFSRFIANNLNENFSAGYDYDSFRKAVGSFYNKSILFRYGFLKMEPCQDDTEDLQYRNYVGDFTKSLDDFVCSKMIENANTKEIQFNELADPTAATEEKFDKLLELFRTLHNQSFFEGMIVSNSAASLFISYYNLNSAAYNYEQTNLLRLRSVFSENTYPWLLFSYDNCPSDTIITLRRYVNNYYANRIVPRSNELTEFNDKLVMDKSHIKKLKLIY